MALRNVALTVNFTVWDTQNNTGRTGDAANLTMRLVKDGGASAAPTNSVTEPDATNMPGVYELALTAAEMNADFVTLAGKSSTADTAVIPQYVHTESGALPNAAPGANGGLPTVDASNRIAGIQGTKNVLDDLNDLTAAAVNTEVDTALSDIGLDHLLSAAVAGADVTDDSVVAKLVSSAATADWDTFVNTTDSLQALRDNQLLQSDILSDATPFAGGNVDATISSRSTLSAAQVNAEVDTALDTAIPVSPTADSINERLKRLEEDVTPTRAGNLDNLDATVSSRSTLSAADVNTEVDNALDTAIPGAPTAGSVNERLKALDDNYTAARAPNLDNLDAAITTRLAASSAPINWSDLAITATTGEVTVNTLSTTAKADVKGEVDTALGTDAISELGSVPAAAPDLKTAVMFLFMRLRNLHTATASQAKIHNDAGTAIGTAALSDDGTTTTRGKYA